MIKIHKKISRWVEYCLNKNSRLTGSFHYIINFKKKNCNKYYNCSFYTEWNYNVIKLNFLHAQVIDFIIDSFCIYQIISIIDSFLTMHNAMVNVIITKDFPGNYFGLHNVLWIISNTHVIENHNLRNLNSYCEMKLEFLFYWD